MTENTITMAPGPTLTLLVPYYNEADYLPATLASLAAQTDRDFRLVLIDNASTDGSSDLARAALAGWDEGTWQIVAEDRPGKIHALERGLSLVDTPLFATLDADTIYPPGYVAQIHAGFARRQDAAMVMALDVYTDPASLADRLRRKGVCLLAWLTPAKCHAGGCGQAYRTAAFHRAGGFDSEKWPFVLEDHEIVNRVRREGGQVYASSHYCMPAPRRDSRETVNWNGWERFLYIALPGAAMDWFWYRFLYRRFAARRLANVNLRTR
ncbi:glycosyltransferase involved in cell wall biosynthesis [Novosphingobium kunmingense]|uniref:Glycosyltransferase involved in cell wall biosynthesis n=1 Tax=Novosphingobium kunmingense TaxID=1211806 RepID=A0A2N0HK43_9SPHN|nr:glycosyltransferase family A protein [Novosphingobium kunmingense]PKB19323.1 glycosyltransferase involved in cell wall biosynthesis [Novosphingobium kunmingense]